MGEEIIILFIIMIFFIIITALTLRAVYEKDLHYIYVHIKTGNRYRIIQECKIKYDGKWMDAIAYIGEKDNEMYVREYNDFTLNFKRLSEWKKD